MVRIKPFRGFRPTHEYAVKVASPPYDVLNSEEAREMAADNPYSFLHVVKPEIDLDPAISLYDARVYAKGAENLKKLMDDAVMQQDGTDNLYIYAQKMGDHRQIGLVAGASIDDYEADLIKKHELTRADKEADRTRHVDTLNANTGPVFLTYKSRKTVDQLVNTIVSGKPTYDFVSADGVQHTFWVVENRELVEKIVAEFTAIDVLYVADGHHRSASATNVRKIRKDSNPHHTGDEEYNFFLAVIFPHDQMMIMAYNRVVTDLNGLSYDQFLEKIKEKFDVTDMTDPVPQHTRVYGMFTEQGWLQLTPKADIIDESDPVGRLDVQILQKNLFEPILGIGDPRKDERINFVGGIRGTKELEKLVKNGKYAVAFSLYPTTIEQLMDIADAGRTMPPKSTWFEPKLRSGLIIHSLSDD